MKKIFAVAAVVLLCGTFALSACNSTEPDEGEIKGQYVEVTGAELTEKLNGIDADKLFGDTSAENWKFGVEFTSEIEFEADVKTAVNGEEVPFLLCDVKEESALNAVLSRTKEQTDIDNLSVKARNNNKLSGKIAKSEILGIDDELNFNYNINAYADDEYLYFQIPDMSDLPLPFEIAEGKFKMPLDYILSTATGVLPFVLSMTATGGDISDVLEKYSLKAYVDDSDGLKIKISANQNSLYAFLEEVADISLETAKGLASFNTFAIDLYLAIGPDGKFDRAGLTADVDGVLNVKAGELGEGGPELKGPVELEADICLKNYTGEVVLPDAEDLKEYIDVTESED